MNTRTAIILAVIIVAIGVGAVVILSSGNFLPTHTQPTGATVHFTIVEADPPSPLAGLNGSYYKSPTLQWPVMNVTLGDTVIITVMNLNSSFEPHGFTIDHYVPTINSIAPGQVRTFTFVANKVGYFRIYCSIECSIHPLMQNGALYVSPS